MKSNLCYGKLTHARLRPKKHVFNINCYMNYVCLNEIEHNQSSFTWPSKKFPVFGYRKKDYIKNEQEPLRDLVLKYVKAEGLSENKIGDVFLLTQFSFFMCCFNPISIFVLYDKQGENILALLLEVTNTPWHEQKIYTVLPEKKGQNEYTAIFKKKLHVSPFMGMDFEYLLNMKDNKDDMYITISNVKNREKSFYASLALKKKTFTRKRFIQANRRYAFQNQKIILLIYMHAFFLWIKGVRYIPHPKKTHTRNQ